VKTVSRQPDETDELAWHKLTRPDTDRFSDGAFPNSTTTTPQNDLVRPAHYRYRVHGPTTTVAEMGFIINLLHLAKQQQKNRKAL